MSLPTPFVASCVPRKVLNCSSPLLPPAPHTIQETPFSPASGPWHMLMLFFLPTHLNSHLCSGFVLDNSSLSPVLPSPLGCPMALTED